MRSQQRVELDSQNDSTAGKVVAIQLLAQNTVLQEGGDVERSVIDGKQRMPDELRLRWRWTLLGGIALIASGAVYFLFYLRRSNRELKILNAQLQRAQNKLQATLDAVPDLLFVMSLDGRYEECHSPRSEFLAEPAQALIGKRVSDILPRDAATICMAALLEAHEKGWSIGKEFELKLPQGDFWFELSVTAKSVEEGRSPRFVALCRDITERKASEAALRDSEEKFRTLIQRIPAAVVVHGADTRILTSNALAQEMLGLSEKQLEGRGSLDPRWHFLREDGSPAAPEDYPVNRVIASRQPLRDVIVGAHLPGRPAEVWALVNADPVVDADGELSQVIVTFIDITQRRKAEQALIAREREFRMLAENIPDNIIRYDRDARKTYVNSATARLIGVTPEQLLGQTPEEIPEDIRAMRLSEFSYRLGKVLDSGEPQEFEVALRHAEHGRQIHSVKFVAERDELGQIIGALMVGRDITKMKTVESELLERENRYRGIFDNVLDALYLLEVTPEGRFRNLEVNPAFEKASGVSCTELVGKYIEETVPAETAAIVVAKYRRCIEAGTTIDEEVTLELPGGVRHFHSTLVPVRDEDGHVRRIVGISRDITERKRMEEALAVREREFRSLAENMPDVVVRYDRECRRLYVNAVLATMAGTSSEELQGRVPQDQTPLVDPEHYLEQLRGTLAEGAPRTVEVEVRRACGEVGWYLSSFAPEFDAAGKVVGALVVARDITERKRMEEALIIREREFRTLAENSPDPIFRYDRDCRLLYVNPVVGRILGRPVESLIGKTIVDESVLASEQNAKMMQAICRVFDSGETVRIDTGFHGRDGQYRDYQMLLVPERDAKGQVITVLSLARDVTVIRDAERRMSRFFSGVPGFVYSFRMGPDGHPSFPFASPGIEDIFGLRPEDVVDDAAKTTHLIHPDDSDRITQAVLESAHTLAPFQTEFRVVQPGKEFRWIECRSFPEREPEGGILWHGLMLDVTERKRMERGVEESREMLRRLANRIESAREDERKHLKREIHDELGQCLLALRLNVSIVDIQLQASNSPLHAKMQRLIEMVDSTIKVVRNVVTSLRPPALDMGIVSALEWLIGEYSGKNDLLFELHVREADIAMDDQSATAVFRIVQESVTNIIRHAGADKVGIVLERGATDYVLEVMDNGCGFDPKLRKEKSFGLISIRERALMLGGSFDISSVPGCTVIRVSFPIRNTPTHPTRDS